MAGYGVASTRWFGSPGGKMGCLGGTLRLYPQTSFLGGSGLTILRRLRRGSCTAAAPRSSLPGRHLRVQASQDGSGWVDDASKAVAALREQLQHMLAAAATACRALWAAQQRCLQEGWARTALAAALALGVLTALVNFWFVPAINRQLPRAEQQVAHALKRDVDIGRVRWIAPTGVLGITPLASMGPVAVGSGPVERSSAVIQRVTLRVDPLQSVLRGRIVLAVNLLGADVHLQQAGNFSWFGYPEDTSPSARELLPGLTKGDSHPQSSSGKRRGGGGRGGGEAGGGGAGGAPPAAPRSGEAPATLSRSHPDLTLRLAAGQTTASSAQTFMERIAEELLSWHERTEAENGLLSAPEDAREPQPALQLVGVGGPIHPVWDNDLLQALSSDPSHSSGEGPAANGPSANDTAGPAQPPARGFSLARFFGGKAAGQRQQGQAANAQQVKQQHQIAAVNAIEFSAMPRDVLRVWQYDKVRMPVSAPQQNDASLSADEAAAAPAATHNNEAAPVAGPTVAEITDGAAAVEVVTAPAGVEEPASAAATSGDNEQTPEQPVEAPAVLPPKPERTDIKPQPPKAAKMNAYLQPMAVRSRRLFSLSPATQAAAAVEAPSTVVAEQAAPAPSDLSLAQSEGVQANGADVAPSPVAIEAADSAQLEDVTALLSEPQQEDVATDGDGIEETSVAQSEDGGASAAALATVLGERRSELINALPQLELPLSSLGASRAAVPPPVAAQAVAAPSAAREFHDAPPQLASAQATLINSAAGVQAGSRPGALDRALSTDDTRRFSQAVVDAATVRRNTLGSRALQQARNWTPANPAVRSSLQATTSTPAAVVSATQCAVDPDQEADDDANAGGLAAAAAAAHADTAATTSKSGKVQLTHPGYFAPSGGPVYTPAPPEALAERRARQRNLATLLRHVGNAVLGQVQRSLVVGSMDVHQGTLHAYIHGENKPRIFNDVAVTMRLGPKYDTLDVDITALPQQRDPSSSKCTMPSPTANRHLRHVTGLAAQRRMQAVEDGVAVEVDSDAGVQQPAKPASGGHLRVQVTASGVADNDLATAGPRFPELTITVTGRDLHAPLAERIVELPMDIDEGRANGQLIIHAHDAASWRFPEFHGRVAVRDVRFHFWDSTDEIKGDLDLVFERDRLYLHNTRGSFGAVPMTLTGDLDLDPLHGFYRLSATVPGVEVNALRATLGVRPTPFPVAGAVAGTMNVTGPLEKPVFSGHARVVRPTPEMLSDCESTAALTTLLADPGAVGAYDHVPFSSAGLLFALDTGTETMTLHAFHADLVGEGRLQGSGRMLVSPGAELDPAAVLVHAEGSGIQAEALAQRYLPHGTQLPPGVVVGPASLTATMRGSHLAPIIEANFHLPEAGTSGKAKFERESTALTLSSPYVEVLGRVVLQPPSFEAVKAAVTQTQATALAQPDLTGCSADVTFRGLDVVPLVSNEVAVRQLAQQSGEALKLRVNGRAKVAGTVERGSNRATWAAAPPGQVDPWQFCGSMDLEDVRLNQLKLFRKLTGKINLSETAISLRGRGLRPDETLDMQVSLPLFSGEAAADGSIQYAGDDRSPDGSMLSLRCGQLLAAANTDAVGSKVDLRLANVKLDELELASLRGELQEVSCSLNFEAQTGRGKLSLLSPRFSGLSGDSLSGGFRWERDVVRLEKLVLQQKHSKYEVQGEYVVPPNTALPTSAADLARRQQQEANPPSGRWRLRVDVPAADMQEILPAARLLQSAASRGPADYERAKAAFIGSVRALSMKAQELNAQLRALAEEVQPNSTAAPGVTALAGLGRSEPHLHLPALQDVHGQWNGSVQAFGGGGGATSCEFDVRGQGWQWGAAKLDAVVANGSYHSEEGVQLQELVLKSGDAKLLVRGSLLNEHQDATVLLTDFPVATLRPLFDAVPALQRAVPAVPVKQPDPMPAPLPLGMLANAIGRVTQGLQQAAPPDVSDSPINGLLYVSGNVGGSQEQPTGEVAVRLYDAAVGPTRLAQAQASARLSENLQLSFNVDVVPAEGHRRSGHIHAAGTIPLADLRSATAAAPLHGSSAPNGSAEPPNAALGTAPLDVRLSVRDSGMAVLTSVTPDFQWQSGEANVSVRLTGTVKQPAVMGSASISKATIDCPMLKDPLVIVAADVRCDNGMLEVESVDARVGRRGHVRVRGSLPVYQPKTALRGAASALAAVQHRMTVDVQGLELRVRNMYTGQYDALLTVRDSVERPVLGGSMRLSRGSIFLIPQGGGQEVGAAAAPLLGASPASGPSVAKVFDLLTRGESGLAQRLEDAVRQEVEAVEHLVEDAGGPNLSVDGLALQFGPDLRAVYPLVMNFSLVGELVVSGPAHPDQIQVSGVLRLPGGDVNLVATQLELDREHANTIAFGGPGAPSGVDPLVDLVMTSGDLRVTILGRASEWADHLVMQSTGGGTAGGEAGEQLDAVEAARILEAKLKAALLADDGQLALSRLAGSTVSTLMPKIETQGQVGGTRWRLVSAPAIPGLLDPLLADPSSLLGSITMGTEVEVQFGRKLQAAMVRKLRESDITTQWTLNYNLNSKLRMQFNISSAPPYPKTLMFQYSSQ